MKKNSKIQLYSLVVVRVLIGWHFLYEGWSKLMNPNWTALGYLMDSKGWFAPLFKGIATNSTLLAFSDKFMVGALLLIGFLLISGLFSKLASYAGISLLLMFFLSHPPLINASYLIPTEGNYLFIDKNLIELATLFVISLFPTGKIGLDRFICNKN